MDQKPHIFFKSLGGVMLVLVAAFVLAWKEHKGKDSFPVVTGTITDIRKEPNVFYFTIDNHPRMMKLLTEEFKTFKSPLQKADQLKPGDQVTVYYKESGNRYHPEDLIYYLDRGQEAIFIRGNDIVSYILFGMAAILLVLIVALRLTGRIF